MNRSPLGKSILFLVMSIILSNITWAQETIEIYPNVQSQKNLKLGVIVTSNYFLKHSPAEFLPKLESAINKYGITEVQAAGIASDEWLRYKGYEKLAANPDSSFISIQRDYFRRIKKMGVYLVVTASEPSVPNDLFDKYPEMRNVANGKFWQFIEDKTKELYEVLPEMDCFDIYPWESKMINNDRQFIGLSQEPYGYPYYSPTDYFKSLFGAYARAAKSKNKDFMLMTFSHYPYQEQIIIDALKERDRNFPFLLDHFSNAGDYNSFNPANNVMLSLVDMSGRLQFDGAGEYWGQSLLPYCFPEEIQARLQHALTHNQNINTLSIRLTWQEGGLLGKPNEINLYALSKLAIDPFSPIEKIWKDWATERFGGKAADKVISALKRTNDIGNKIFYLEGMWVFNHSQFANLSYLENHIINYAKSSSQFKPENINGNYKMNELLNYPREYLIQELVLAERDEALRLNTLSLQDIDEGAKELDPEDYKMLKEQLEKQHDMVIASKLQLEALFRYRIEKLNAPEKGIENRQKLEVCLQRIEKFASEIEQGYRDNFPLLKAAMLHEYAIQVREAVANYK